MGTWELMGTWVTDPSHLVAETGADPSMAIRKLKTCGFRSGSPMSALVLSLIAELNMVCAKRKILLMNKFEMVKPVDPVAAIHCQIDSLNIQEQLNCLSDSIKTKYKDIFDPILHLNDLPTNVYCRIQLKDTSKTFATCSYTTPWKYKEAWSTLIQQHLDAGQIQPSNSAHASPAFLIPKSDHMVLLHWVNDYWMLNANTVTDSHSLPHINDILADCGKGKIWSKLDMTILFFQMRVHPDDVHLMAVTMPLGLYKWLTMPMGLQNSPAIHQRRITTALREYIGKFCHIYLDDIAIWSQDVIKHTQPIDLIMKALQKAWL